MTTIGSIIVTGALTTSAFCLGAAAQRRAVRNKFKVITPLLAQAFANTVERSFEEGATPESVIDGLEEELKFIEQVL